MSYVLPSPPKLGDIGDPQQRLLARIVPSYPAVPERFDVIGCKISRLDRRGAIREIIDRLKTGDGGYVCFANAHVTVTAHSKPQYRNILNNSFLTLPDGKPVFWMGRLRGCRDIEQIPGPDFLLALLAHKTNPPLRHYFYGAKPDVVEALIRSLRQRFPEIIVAGHESPPFRPLSAKEDADAIWRIRESKADIVWVGLGTPKQDFWMESHRDALRPAILMAVGAAFDFHAGNIRRAPGWMRAVGLEWLHRLFQEPRRLWRRYLVDNTLFLLYASRSLLWPRSSN